MILDSSNWGTIFRDFVMDDIYKLFRNDIDWPPARIEFKCNNVIPCCSSRLNIKIRFKYLDL